MTNQTNPAKDDQLNEATQKTNTELTQEFTQLENTMHETEQFRTLEEQVADMKRRGIDPAKSYQKWDDDEEE